MTNAPEGTPPPSSELPLATESAEVEQDKAETPRHCGYSKCGRVLPKNFGRPRVYCEDTRWNGKTCKQMATAEREAVQAAAMDVPLARFREDATQLVPHLESLGAKLAEVKASVQGVDAGALARIDEEEQIARAAVARANEAEAEKAKAINRADKLAAEARQARAEKVEAERVVRGTIRDADEKIAEARAKTSVCERAQAGAEAKAHEVSLNLTAQVDRYKQLDRRFEDLATTNKELTKANGAAEAARKAAESERATAEARVKEAAEAAATSARAATTAETEAAAARAELAKLRAELTKVQGVAVQQGEDLAAAERELASQQERAERAETTAAAEKTRADKLAAELATAGQLAEQQSQEVTRLTTELGAALASAATVDQLRELIKATKS